MKTNESGRSMIEMLGVLAIMGILTTSGIALYSKALYQRKVSSVIDQASELMTNIRNMYVSRRDYTGLDSNSSKIGKYKIIPGSMKVTTVAGEGEGATSTNKIIHTMGGEVKFEVNSEEKKKFDMTFYGLDAVTCNKLAMADWGDENMVCANGDAAANCAKKQLTAATAATKCQCPSADCYIHWTITK